MKKANKKVNHAAKLLGSRGGKAQKKKFTSEEFKKWGRKGGRPKRVK